MVCKTVKKCQGSLASKLSFSQLLRLLNVLLHDAFVRPVIVTVPDVPSLKNGYLWVVSFCLPFVDQLLSTVQWVHANCLVPVVIWDLVHHRVHSTYCSHGVNIGLLCPVLDQGMACVFIGKLFSTGTASFETSQSIHCWILCRCSDLNLFAVDSVDL